MGKVGLLFLVLVLALASVGVAFAAWTDTITISGSVTTGELDWEFMGPIIQADTGPDQNCFWRLEDGTWGTAPEGKDVGSTILTIGAGNKTIGLTINNAYPYYGNHIALKLHGLGTIPLKFWKLNFYDSNGDLVFTAYEPDEYVYLDLDEDGYNDVEVWYGDSFGDQFHYCTKRDVSFEILVLQPAPQNASLTFTMEFVGIQWNEYPLP
jgi:predicted ribosomally synthesized peptide with SipW-like signal peptide